MLTVYKKVEKSTDSLNGIENQNNGLNFDKPFLFSIGSNSQNNFDLLQKSLLIARVACKEDNGASFKLDSFPVDFLSFAYGNGDNEESIVSELFEKYFYPYLTAKGMDYESIKKQAHMMNFLSFTTSGHKLFTDIEKKIIQSLKQDGFTDEQINNILSQISLGCIGASIINYTNKVNTVYFVDVNDSLITNNSDYLKKRLDAEGQDSIFGGVKNNLLFIFNGNGSNEINNYFSKDGNSIGAISYAISYYLENSIMEKVPLTPTGIYNNVSRGKEKDNYSFRYLDESLSYSSADKHDDYSLKLRRELDTACEAIASRPRINDDTVNYILNEVYSRCSDTVYYQICAKLGLVSNPSAEIMNKKTDKEIIEGMQQLLGISPQEKDSSNGKLLEK